MRIKPAKLSGSRHTGHAQGLASKPTAMSNWTSRLLPGALAGALVGLAAQVSANPLTAIEWLEQSTQSIQSEQPQSPLGQTSLGQPPLGQTPLGQTPLDQTAAAPLSRPQTNTPQVTDVVLDARPPEIAVVPLDAPDVSGVGLLPSHVSGFPATLWQRSSTSDLIALMDRLPVQHPVPAAQSLIITLLLAEATPPSGDRAGFLSKRLEALMARGAVRPAQEMLRLLPAPLPSDLTSVAAELALLQGETTALCADIASLRAHATDPGLQIYCQAQTGAWVQAATSLSAERALGGLDEGRYQRLLRFLDPELAETLPPLPPPNTKTLSPLDYRLMAAAGDPLPTSALPLPFAQSDLSGDAGWKPRIEAAERLVRAGAIGAAQLFSAYTERVPAASGGVWDRAEAVQRFEMALRARDPGAVERELVRVWPILRKHGLAVPFATIYAARLKEVSLPVTAARDAVRIMAEIPFLSSGYESHARDLPDDMAGLAFTRGLALGTPVEGTNARDRALAAAWKRDAMPKAMRQAAQDGRVGEVVLQILDLLARGAAGDLQSLTRGLSSLRVLGLEDAARRAALQVHLTVDARP